MIHEQELGAEQADAGRARIDRRARVFRQFDVRAQLDARAAQRLRGRKFQPLQLALLERLLALPVRILFQHDRRGIDDHDAVIAVDDDQVVLADQRARVLHADRRRNAETARDDRRMRGASAEIGDEALKRLRLELHHVGRRDVVRDHDHFVARTVHAVRQRHRCAGERLQHALHHLLDVGFALAQVFVFDIVEMARQALELFGQRPLHVVAARADQVDGFLHEHRIVQDH